MIFSENIVSFQYHSKHKQQSELMINEFYVILSYLKNTNNIKSLDFKKNYSNLNIKVSDKRQSENKITFINLEHVHQIALNLDRNEKILSTKR